MAALSFLTYGQSDTIKDKFEYELCIFHPEEKSIVLQNKKIGIADTVMALITGTIFDNKGKPIDFVVLNLISLAGNSKYGTFTDSLGNFKLFLPSNKYRLITFSVGYSSLTIDKLQLNSGEIREIKLKLGVGSGVYYICNTI
ncbi:MAG TPA: carboxypeptidase-like regulatory domain-containing protein [Saprospiraceae bacterium]|nr:carboxypeptidase-like regulatory domain-containing protein [Saprospiraceae bacterium]